MYLSNFTNKNIFIDIPLQKCFYYRYVDDIFMIISSDIPETTLISYLNFFGPHLKFTMETEIQITLNFLDVAIQKENKNNITSWFRKASKNLNFTGWDSFGFKIHKINSVKAMIKRLKVICSDKQTLIKNLKKLKISFIRSNYPVNLLYR